MSILILAEHDGAKLKQSTRQAVTAAAAWQLPIHVLVAAERPDVVAQEAANISNVARVIKVEAAHFSHPLAEDVSATILKLAPEYKIILASHTALSKSVLPRVAALLDVAMLSDIVQITAPATYVRPIYAGNVFATVQSSDSTQILTVRGTSFEVAADNGNAEIVSVEAPAANTTTTWLREEKNVSDRPDLASAHVVISGGRSLGEQFNRLLDPIAHKLNAAIGATRACVDAGFAPNDIQVGQTGTVVAPELYIAVGISGAMQHIAGIKDSKVIVAINHDPDAPIFKYADYGLVQDLFKALPELNAALN
jgi:electron transfer flavoprotein alpha subunit